ncbi:MAG: hypothetical protein JO013_10350 [Alphaproteobacteria bacterium]|nr:hypothetical protein [Alphaproteobacteria bacterium]
MLRFLLPGLALLVAACTRPAIDMMQAPTAPLAGSVYIYDIDLSLGPDAKKEVAAADARVAAKAPGRGYATMAFAPMLRDMFKQGAAARGLSAGRALTIVVELDHLRVPAAGGALMGKHDRLAGLVRVADARTGQALATFYVDVDQHYPGLIGLAVREGNGGVRERLAAAFVRHVLDQIAPAAKR